MTDEIPESLIPYDEIVQDALRAVVGRVLGEIEKTGALPGELTLGTAAPNPVRGRAIVRYGLPEVEHALTQHQYGLLEARRGELETARARLGEAADALESDPTSASDAVEKATQVSA